MKNAVIFRTNTFIFRKNTAVSRISNIFQLTASLCRVLPLLRGHCLGRPLFEATALAVGNRVAGKLKMARSGRVRKFIFSGDDRPIAFGNMLWNTFQ